MLNEWQEFLDYTEPAKRTTHAASALEENSGIWNCRTFLRHSASNFFSRSPGWCCRWRTSTAGLGIPISDGSISARFQKKSSSGAIASVSADIGCCRNFCRNGISSAPPSGYLSQRPLPHGSDGKTTRGHPRPPAPGTPRGAYRTLSDIATQVLHRSVPAHCTRHTVPGGHTAVQCGIADLPYPGGECVPHRLEPGLPSQAGPNQTGADILRGGVHQRAGLPQRHILRPWCSVPTTGGVYPSPFSLSQKCRPSSARKK